GLIGASRLSSRASRLSSRASRLSSRALRRPIGPREATFGPGSRQFVTAPIQSGLMDAPRSLRTEATPPVRALNRLLSPLGPAFPDVSVETFARNAERVTRLDDWGDDATVARFRRAATAVRDNPHLSAWGRISLRIYLQSKFVNHLLRTDFVKKHPEVREVPI